MQMLMNALWGHMAALRDVQTQQVLTPAAAI